MPSRYPPPPPQFSSALHWLSRLLTLNTWHSLSEGFRVIEDSSTGEGQGSGDSTPGAWSLVWSPRAPQGDTAPDAQNGNWPDYLFFTGFLLLPLSLPHFLANISWDHLPDNLPAFTPWPLGKSPKDTYVHSSRNRFHLNFGDLLFSPYNINSTVYMSSEVPRGRFQNQWGTLVFLRW